MARHVIVISAACALLFAAQAAIAQDRIVTRHVDISVGDINLGTAAGQAALSVRIDSAARRACGGSIAFDSHYRDAPAYVSQSFATCRKAAVAQAYKDLGMTPRFTEAR